MADVVAKPLSTIFEKSEQSGKDPNDCRKEIVHPFLKTVKRRTLVLLTRQPFSIEKMLERKRKAFEQGLY